MGVTDDTGGLDDKGALVVGWGVCGRLCHGGSVVGSYDVATVGPLSGLRGGKEMGVSLVHTLKGSVS